jgi:beta-lactamase regulating signal transducer with metallopeptidase domain/ketosteroid isomerase-like protein
MPPAREAVPDETAVPAVSVDASAPGVEAASLPSPQHAPAAALSAQGWLFGAWLCGAAILAGGFVWQMMTVKGIIARSRPAPAFLTDLLQQAHAVIRTAGPVSLRMSEEISGPAVCGLMRPVILIPAALPERLAQEQFEAVLLHELSHIQRGDLWLNTVQTFFQIFYFYNPFVRLANHFIRKTREQANDERVLIFMNGRREYYSATLIDVAAAVIGRPVYAVRLIGVAEPKTHLHERITLMMRKSIPTHSKLGFTGILVLVLLAAVLLPMAGRRKAEASPIRTDTPPMSLEQFLAASKTVARQRLNGNQSADAAMAAGVYTEDAVILPPRHLPVLGKSAVTELYDEGISKGERILTADVQYENIRMSGRYVFTVDRASLAVRVPEIEHLLLVHCKTLTVWEVQSDGTLKIKVDAWNFDQTPSSETLLTGRGITAKNGAFRSAANSQKAADASQETLEKVKQLSKEFHAVCLKGDAALTASYYAEDVFYLADKTGLMHGREQIKATITSFNRQYRLENVEDRIVFAEGTEEMVYVVNNFLWKFKDIAQGDQVFSYPGKGVHVWQKQADGSWKILVDVNSANEE